MSSDILVSCDGLSRSHGARTLFQGVSFGVFAGERVGLVGPNGSGKTTLLRILAGLETADAGQVSRRRLLRVGFVAQAPDLPGESTVEDVVASGLSDLGLADHELAGRVASTLGQAGFVSPSQPAGTLSGGWKKRLAIARELAREPDLLLLDEPTNHLDLDGIEWLERILVEDPRACLVASHDRRFLENVAQRMMELSRSWPAGLFTARGGYATFLEKRDEALRAQEAGQAALANVVRREVAWARRGAKARTTKSQSRLDNVARLSAELADVEERTATRSAGIDLVASERQSKRLLVARGVSKSLSGRSVLAGIDLTLGPGTRLGVIGTNGSGKTTLLRLLDGELLPDDGSIVRAPGLTIVRFEQDRESLDPSASLTRALAPAGDFVTFAGSQVHVAGWARRFLFRPDQMQVPVGRLSGGEQARILIARLMLRPADVLLLDEPTNDLDIATLEVLEQGLVEFPGALVLVTHDRLMLDRVATSLLSLEPDGRAVAYADMSQWEASRREATPSERPRRPSAGSAGPATPKGAPAAPGLKRLTFLEKQEWAGMEERILDAERHLKECAAAASDPAVASDAAALHERHAALALAEAAVARLYARWAELEAKQA